MNVTRDVLEVPRIQLKIIHTSKDEAAITSKALCILAHDWVKKQMDELDIQLNLLKDKVNYFLNDINHIIMVDIYKCGSFIFKFLVYIIGI